VTGVTLTIFKLYQSRIRTFMFGMATVTRSSLVDGRFFAGECMAVKALARHSRRRSWIEYCAKHRDWPIPVTGMTITATVIGDDTRVVR